MSDRRTFSVRDILEGRVLKNRRVLTGAAAGLVLLVLATIGACLALAGDSEDPEITAVTITPTRTPTSTSTPTSSASPTPTPTASAPPVTPTPAPPPQPACTGPGAGPSIGSGAPGSPVAGGYIWREALSQSYLGDAADAAIELALIPGRPNEAVIALQSGLAYRVALDQSFPSQVWGDLRNQVDYGGEEGLLSLAFSPNYQSDCRVYVYYTRGSPQPSVLSRITSTPSGGLEAGSEEVLLTVEQPYANHNGGHIVFGNDGYLYIGFGDGGSGGDPGDRAQNMSTLLGKMIRIDVSPASGYAIPPDNPFEDGPNGNRDEIYALGLRNPYRFTSDPVSGEIWIGDVGQGQWEEVSRLQKGGNFGWDCYEGPDTYDYTSAKCDGKTFVPPRAWYDHSLGRAVTGGVIYRGQSMPELYGWYVYADFYSGNIWALNPSEASGEVLLSETPLAIASFTLAADGEIYLVSYSNGIYMLSR